MMMIMGSKQKKMERGENFHEGAKIIATSIIRLLPTSPSLLCLNFMSMTTHKALSLSDAIKVLLVVLCHLLKISSTLDGNRERGKRRQQWWRGKVIEKLATINLKRQALIIDLVEGLKIYDDDVLMNGDDDGNCQFN
jgi:hypothetical protein